MPGSNLIQSLLRGLDVVEILAGRPDGIPLRQIAEELEVAPSTAHNLLRTLAARGFVEKAGTLYRTGPQLERLHRQTQSSAYLETCDRELLALRREFPNIVAIYVERRQTALVALRRVAPGPSETVERPAARTMPLYSSISALVYQAFTDADSRALLRLESPFSENGARQWESIRHLEDFLEEARQRGYAASPFESEAAYVRVAAPVTRAGNGLIGVLGASLIIQEGHQRVTPEQLATRLQQAAAEIGRA